MPLLSKLETRALKAYFRPNDGGYVTQPSAPETVTHKGLTYIYLSNMSGVLACYRVRTVNGKQVLKRLKRYPNGLVG
jgi:hypothetical protein